MAGPDLTDVRVMIPRVRRSLEGPAASASGVSSLTDEQYEALIADAVADIVLYSGGLFGHTLVVAGRDEIYGAPSAWATSEILSEEEVTVIVAQAALNYFFHSVGGESGKTQERIRDDAGEWEWTRSAQVLRDHIAALRRARDEALEALRAANPSLDTYIDLLAVRDATINRQITTGWGIETGYAPAAGQLLGP